MKTKTLVKKLFAACVTHNKEEERIAWLKLIQKSLRHKHTFLVH